MTYSAHKQHRAVVLLAEDNENDAMLMREGFKRANAAVDLHVVANGEECLAFLRREGGYASAPMPDLLLLDLNMPRKDGREVMAEIVADKQLQHLPVIVLTTSADEREILSLYRLRCNSYVIKPVNFEHFLKIVRSIVDYWFTAVRLPQTD